MADSTNKRSARLGLQLSIRLYLNADTADPLLLTTRNISNTGLFVDCDSPLSLTIGQGIYVELAEALGDGEPQKVLTTVVRIEKEGFALKYNDV